MKFTMNVLSACLMCLGLVTSMTAQKQKTANFKEGLIQYKIEIEGAPEVSQFMNNSIINLYLKGEDSKMDISIMGGMANFQLINNMKENLLTLLMDVPSFYEKTAVSIDENSDIFKQLKEAKNKNRAPEKDLEVTYFKNKRKRIAKYPCYKAEVGMDGLGDKLTIYLTDKLRPVGLSQIEKTIGNVKGFPLAFEMNIEGLLVKVTAVDILKQPIETTTFDIPDSYAKKSMDQFKEEIERKMGTGNSGGVGL